VLKILFDRFVRVIGVALRCKASSLQFDDVAGFIATKLILHTSRELAKHFLTDVASPNPVATRVSWLE